MNDYLRVKVAKANTVDKYLTDGWEIIEVTKEWTGDSAEGTTLKYHMGLSARKLVEKYEAIVKDYESNGLKEQLFKKIAESNGKDINNYELNSWYNGNDETAKYMTNYDRIVDGIDSIGYGVKIKTTSEYEDIDF